MENGGEDAVERNKIPVRSKRFKQIAITLLAK